MHREFLRIIIQEGRIEWLKHSLQRLMERGIGRSEVKEVLIRGEIIEEYQHDKPFPSALVFGWVGSKPLHVVAALDPKNRVCYIITTYIPDSKHFESDFKTRRHEKEQ